MEAKNINQLVTENLSYVKSLANRFKGKGVDFDDLVSEGYMAMTQAAQKYDTERGTQFIAYAEPFIRKAMIKQKISRCIINSLIAKSVIEETGHFVVNSCRG